MAMATTGTRLVDRLKDMALRVGTEGVRYVVEGTVTAVRVMDRLQELLPRPARAVRVRREPARGASGGASGARRQQGSTPRARPHAARSIVSHPSEELPEEVREEARATGERVLREARAAQERIQVARPARNPLKVSAMEGLEETPGGTKRRGTARKTARTQGRKTMATATAPKRATARTGLKAKRGQKLKH